jgi:hypothetical protein
MAPQAFEQLGRGPLDRLRQLALEQALHQVQLGQVRRGALGDEVALVRSVGEQTLHAQRAQRFAQRNATDADLTGQVLLTQLLAGRELATQDAHAQVGHRAVDRGAVSGQDHGGPTIPR